MKFCLSKMKCGSHKCFPELSFWPKAKGLVTISTQHRLTGIQKTNSHGHSSTWVCKGLSHPWFHLRLHHGPLRKMFWSTLYWPRCWCSERNNLPKGIQLASGSACIWNQDCLALEPTLAAALVLVIHLTAAKEILLHFPHHPPPSPVAKSYWFFLLNTF